MVFTRSLVLVLAATLSTACGAEHPTAPDVMPGPGTSRGPAPPPAANPLQMFSVSGTVADEQGLPIAAAPVVLRYQNPSCCTTTTAMTDAAGRYALAFEARPSGLYAARAEIIVDGFDWYYRDIVASDKPVIEEFRLRRVTRITAGESVEIALTPANGSCIGFLAPPCGQLRVTVPGDGELTLEADGTQSGLFGLWLEANEREGNPVTLPVKAGQEIWVEIGLSRATPVRVDGRVRVITLFNQG